MLGIGPWIFAVGGRLAGRVGTKPEAQWSLGNALTVHANCDKIAPVFHAFCLQTKGGPVKDPKLRRLIGNFAIEILIYAALVVGYFLLVLRLLGEPLEGLFSRNLILYAIVGLLLIIAQAVLLETITSLIMRWLGLDQLQ